MSDSNQIPAAPPADQHPTEKRVKFITRGGKAFVLRVPTESIVGQALELAHPFHKGGAMREMTAAQGAQVRLCLVSINGRQVRMDEIGGDDLFSLIDIKEYAMLVKALETLTTPPADEVDDFLKSMTPA